MAWSEFIEGLILTRRGKPQDALIILDRAARRARKEGELRLLSMALSESVPPLLLLGEKRRALRDAAEALEIAKTTRAKMVEAVALRAQAEAAGADGDLEGMERYFEEAKSLFEALRNTIETAETHARWADAMRAAGTPEQARAHWSKALQLFESRHLRRRSGPVRAALVALPS
jgi:tetratricopeptide (TPR) repeat protein